MMMNCFCGMVDRRKTFSLISSRDHCQRSSPSRISNTPRAGFEPAQNLSPDLVEWSCAVVTTTTPWHHNIFWSVYTVICQRRPFHICYQIYPFSLYNVCNMLFSQFDTNLIRSHGLNETYLQEFKYYTIHSFFFRECNLNKRITCNWHII